jgi:fatty acid-binding protein DegV
VIHTHAEALAADVARRLRAKIAADVQSFDVFEAGPVIGTHAGPGAVGIFVLPV